MREKGSVEHYPPQMDISYGEDDDDGDDEGLLPRMIGSHISILTDESEHSLWSPNLASLSLPLAHVLYLSLSNSVDSTSGRLRSASILMLSLMPLDYREFGRSVQVGIRVGARWRQAT